LYSVLGPNDPADKERSILLLSRVSAVVLLALYVLYLWFQIRTHPNLFESENEQCDGNEPEEPVVGVIPALLILVVTTVLVSICADYLVGSIDETVEQAHIGKTFVGLILIPIVGNAAEHVTAVVMAVRNKMDLAMAVAIGSSIQIALFVTPFLVLLGWVVMDQPMTLHFESLEVVTFAASALIVAYIVRDGYSNYLEGALLLGLYLIIAVAFFVSPDFA
jgi:Ca2+:H+ antiporter